MEIPLHHPSIHLEKTNSNFTRDLVVCVQKSVWASALKAYPNLVPENQTLL